jgi:hypothetical protein
LEGRDDVLDVLVERHSELLDGRVDLFAVDAPGEGLLFEIGRASCRERVS